MSHNTEDIRNRFKFFLTTDPEIAEIHHEIRKTCEALAIIIDGYVPDGREKAIALTKIEEVSFWANAGLAREHGHPYEGPASDV